MSENQERRISDELLRSIGLVAFYWSVLEAHLEFLILKLQDIPFQTGLVLTSHLGFRARCYLLHTAVNDDPALSDSASKELKQLIVRTEAAYPKRNQVVHSVWTPTDDPLVARYRGIRARGRLKLIDEPMHVNEIENIAEEIHSIGGDFLLFQYRYGLLPKDGPDDSP